MSKKIAFVTGTRADFGKQFPLMKKIEESKRFDCYIFTTGMHTLKKYGRTFKEIEKRGFSNVYRYINQQESSPMDIILSNTITGFSLFIKELNPDLIIVHGDRIEALAGAVVGALNNILVAHVEGGEVSGTIDESIRHSITKLSHLHFVANIKAKNRIMQLGESADSIFVIGSPEVDVMKSEFLPKLDEVKEHYDIPYDDFCLFIYHPVTTKLNGLKKRIKIIIDVLIESNLNYILIKPNNDPGNQVILEEIKRLEKLERFKIYPSVRFFSFLTLLKNSTFIIGNSSSGVREASFYNIPAINIGTRQNNRSNSNNIIQVSHSKKEILQAVNKAKNMDEDINHPFGMGESAEKFYEIIISDEFWNIDIQKEFVDINRI